MTFIKETRMTTIHINKRGTLTLPKDIRKRYGLEKGGDMIIEPSEKGVFLKPAASFPIEVYSDSRVAEFDHADADARRYIAKKKSPSK
jgi:bifunctional DNA-binding transcriptional regulator/antitoxin component of YhaV-PrlF toxin-antitoxin module